MVRKVRSFLLLLCLPVVVMAADLPLLGIAHVSFRVSDIDEARAFYAGVLGYDEVFQSASAGPARHFKVNDHQYIEIYPDLPPGEDERLKRIGLETSDIELLHRLLSERGLEPPKIRTNRAGNRVFMVQDPGRHMIEFVQYMPGSLHWKARGNHLGERRISDRLRHTGVHVADEDAANAFWRDQLGFREFWRGGSEPGRAQWVGLRMPGERGDYIEYMLYSEPPSRGRLGSMHHICLEVPDIQQAHRAAVERGVPDIERHQPKVGRIRKWLFSIFDADGSRTEYMEPNTVDHQPKESQ